MQIRHFLTAVPVAVSLLWALPNHVAAQGFTFEFIDQDLFPITLGDAAWGDLNRDGRMDLVFTGLTEFADDTPIGTTFINQGEVGSVDARGDSVWRQNYLPQGQGVRAAWLSSTAWSDVDHDGRLDFTITGATSLDPPYSPTLRMYRLVGSEFEQIQVDIPGVLAGSIDWGDYDNDGDDDLLLTGESSDGYVTRIYERSGARSTIEFFDSGHRLMDVGLGEGKFGDYDNDGDLDVLLTGDTGEGFTTVLYRNDDGVLSEVPRAFSDLAFSSIDWGDYDNDGDLDVLLAGGFLSPLIVEGQAVVYRNDGGDSFTDIGADIDGTFYGAAAWADYDNDGLIDIMLSGATNLQSQRLGRLYRNEGNGVFRLAINVAGLLFSEAAIGDYDYDGDLDILQVGDGVTTQYRNDQLRVNDPPTIPSGLTANGAEGGAVLSWSPATDPQTPTPGLSYNIRIGTSPGVVDIVSPLADITTGRRYVSDLGNVQSNTSWTVRGLDAGTYYWSVQAVDNAFNPSGWAAEASFSVSEAGGVATDIESEDLPSGFHLSAGFPNPFTDRTTIGYNLSESQYVVAEVYTALGERIITIDEGVVGAGRHQITWDGRDALGRDVGAGVYLLRFVSNVTTKTLRLVRVRS